MSVLEIVALRKDYPGTVALREISLRFEGGRVHALVGKNGAGKSTLVKILAGATRPTAGSVKLDGRPLGLRSPADALREGIVAVHQELSLVPELSVMENILLGRLPRRKGIPSFAVDWDAARRTASAVCDLLGVSLDMDTPARSLGIASRQSVEIAKAMSYDPAVLMLDEPTSALSQQETERLFFLLRGLAARGVVVLYITHRLQELPLVADSVTVLTDGRVAGTVPAGDATPEMLASLMFGRIVRHQRPSGPAAQEETALSVRALSRAPSVHNVSFSMRAGEILGIAGLLGSGRTELLRLLCGADIPDDGVVEVGGRTLRPSNPRQMGRLGVVLVPEDRKTQGLVQSLSTCVNLCLTRPAGAACRGMTTRAMESRVALPLVASLGIAAPALDTPVATLSGGNQQKVSVGKWLGTNPRVLLLDEPTRGIDVEAKQQIFDLVWDLSRRGIASVVVSSELEELLVLCDRILILRDGRVRREVRPADVTPQQLLALCFD